jgi:hypothetical protein
MHPADHRRRIVTSLLRIFQTHPGRQLARLRTRIPYSNVNWTQGYSLPFTPKHSAAGSKRGASDMPRNRDD